MDRAPYLVRLLAVSKTYPRLSRPGDRLRALGAVLRGGDYPGYRVLHEVTFEVSAGRSVAVIGENGAGKSTLLKIIAGVVTPTTGQVAVSGRVGALLELGAGFHPEYSGRDNILLSGSLMGITEAELREKLDRIVSFADIGSYIDEPIKHYSSGMVVRLGFAVVSAMRPELLITDEVLAVGDESFQKKCVRWIEDYLAEGGTLLLCSHSMFHVQKLCREAIWLRQGRVFARGGAFEIAQEYLAYHEAKNAKGGPGGAAIGSGAQYRVEDLRLRTVAGESIGEIRMGSGITVRGTLRSPDGRPPAVCVGIVRADGTPVYGVVSDAEGFVPQPIDPHRFAFELRFEPLSLLPGRYTVRAHAMDPEGMRLFDTVERAFRVSGESRELGLCRLPHRWGVGHDHRR